MICHFGGSRVGTFLDRLCLHLQTARFLANRRKDTTWESACDHAELNLQRPAAQLPQRTLLRKLHRSPGSIQGPGFLHKPGKTIAPTPPNRRHRKR